MEKVSKFLPSNFDLSFVDAVEYLNANKHEHRRFKLKKELLKQMNIEESAYSSIKAKSRGVPKDKVADCIHYLTSEFGVSEEFLRHRRGNIMGTPITKEGLKATSYDQALYRIKELELQLQHSKELLTKTQQMLDETRYMLKQQNKLVEKLSK